MKYKNKYNSIWTKCNQGHNHQSKIEAAYCNDLNLLKKVKKIIDYKTQIKIPLIVNDILICNHIIDFEIINNNGNKEFHEVKGMETKDWKLKKKLTEILYPTINYVVIKKR